MFGRNKKAKETYNKYVIQYLGGHPLFPKDYFTALEFLNDALVIGEGDIIIPYNKITNIENSNEKKFDVDRLVSFGPFGLIKKNHKYTVINTQEISIVIDFGPSGKLELGQRTLYSKMISSKKIVI